MVKLDDVQTLKQIAKRSKRLNLRNLESHWRIYSHRASLNASICGFLLHNWLKGFRSFLAPGSAFIQN